MARTEDITVTVPPHLCELADATDVEPLALVLAVIHGRSGSTAEFTDKVNEMQRMLDEGHFRQSEQRMKEDPDGWLRAWKAEEPIQGPSVWAHILDE